VTEAAFRAAVAELVARDPHLETVIAAYGMPPIWSREPGFATLVLLILEQQVSLASARATFDRLATLLGAVDPEGILTLDDDALRGIGFSRQKTRYVRVLATAIIEGELDLGGLASLNEDDARGALIALPGIGPWTADVYLLACLGSPDVWPVGDVALQAAAQRVKGLEARPSAAELEVIGEQWRPFRSVAAQLLWHRYLGDAGRL
jgi:DNA-3-methyladenine glycosylase II